MSDAFEEFGPFLVYERLGQGGMATVHRAEKRGVGIRKPIALKRLLAHVAADPDLVKLFVDEARLASHLRHANVAQTYELGKVGDTFFIAMEYASGPTLTQIMRQCQKMGGKVPLPITVAILCQVCEALDHAHNLCDESGKSLRIIHRDVSPANIIVTNAGIVKLIDFGIAKATISSVKTQTGFIKGKFGYIAPEYLSGKIDARADLFAVGVVAHEMLAGRRLFEGQDDFETIANIREMKLQPPSRWNPEVTADLDDIVLTALERNPDRRWQSAAAMQVALSNAGRELGVVVGSQQLVDWIHWAFRQTPGEAKPWALDTVQGGPIAEIDSSIGPPSRRDSSVLIELGHAPSERSDLATPLAHAPRTPSSSDLDPTALLQRIRLSTSDLEPLTPLPIAPPPAPAPPTPRSSRELAAQPPPPRASRELPAQPSPARSSRELAAEPPPRSASRELAAEHPPPPRTSRELAVPLPPGRRSSRDYLVVAPDGMAEGAPQPPASPADAAAPAPAVAAPEAEPEERSAARTALWLVLLILVLGIAAMAGAYYWPGEL